MAKLTTLDHLTTLAARVKAEDDALGLRIDAAVESINELIATNGEPNVLEGVKVNGQALAITDKMVDILIASGEENGTLSVNGAAVAITGLQSLAYKAEITESELGEALKASIAAKATSADLEALTVRVGAIETAGYQTAEQVQAAIKAAVAESGHAHFEKIDSIPTAETAEENVLYLVLNAETQHYDIYALVSGKVELLDDTTVDLSGYSTTEVMQEYVAQQIAALNIDQYATDEALQAVIVDVSAIQAALANYYTKEEIDATLEGYATDEEAATAAADAIAAATASDEEVSAALDQVFGENA